MPQCTRPVIIFATTLCGVAAGLGYRGNLQVVNQIAPERLRAEVVSSYFICCFIGNALPVIGVGVLSAAAGSIMASLVSAATISVFAVLALGFGAKFTHAQKFQTRIGPGVRNAKIFRGANLAVRAASQTNSAVLFATTMK